MKKFSRLQIIGAFALMMAFFDDTSAIACGYQGSSSKPTFETPLSLPVFNRLPLSCQPCKEGLCIKNELTQQVAAGQLGTKGWMGSFPSPDSGKGDDSCSQHISTQENVLAEEGLDPATTPIAASQAVLLDIFVSRALFQWRSKPINRSWIPLSI